MCGITTIAGSTFDKNRYRTNAMLNELEHRGPDGTGECVFPQCWLGNQRLAIVDLKKGNQPMSNGKLAITFNGEIYNYRELRVQLAKDGYNFQTDSDTETILIAYRKWGYDCPKKLDGIFSFAIWDDERKELFVARDRLGKKPLYYFLDSGTILLASEIKSILASGVVKPLLDCKAIDNYLRLMYIPPWKSVYGNIYQVPPAHCGIFKDGKLKLKRYWEISYHPINIPYQEAKAEVRRIIINAVKKRISASDVEVGILISGGIDSSLIALIAANELGYPLKAFSVNYDGLDELPFAQQVCQKTGSKHFITHIDNCLVGELDKVIAYFDEPHADTSDFPQHLLSQLTAKEVKVALSGDGADELFLGYKWHVAGKIPKQENTDAPADLFYERLNSVCAFPPSLRLALWNSPTMLNDDIAAEGIYENIINPIEKVMLFDLTSHLPGQILSKIDRAGMMHGLEIRSPFLDIDLVDFVYNLPYEYKVCNGVQKYILRDILSDYMPPDFTRRNKQGFGAPIEIWLNNAVTKEYVYDNLGSCAKIRSIFSGKGIDECLGGFYVNERRHERAAQRLWVLLCLERWMVKLKEIL